MKTILCLGDTCCSLRTLRPMEQSKEGNENKKEDAEDKREKKNSFILTFAFAALLLSAAPATTALSKTIGLSSANLLSFPPLKLSFIGSSTKSLVKENCKYEKKQFGKVRLLTCSGAVLQGASSP